MGLAWRLRAAWEARSAWLVLLWPFEGLYRALVVLRRRLYRHGVLRTVRLPVPVVVVGNLTVGGTGKTPLVLWLVERLHAAGHRPGIVTRGYGGRVRGVHVVSPQDDPALTGDEPLLLARRSGCPVCVGKKRVAAARALIAQGCDVIVSDDGLQHLALGRDFAIVVVDAECRFGNGHCLPAGPLREPVARLAAADAVVWHGGDESPLPRMRLVPVVVREVATDRELGDLDAWRGRCVHAMAGIGHPARFFRMLERAGIEVIPHAFADHHAFTRDDLPDDALLVLMTEKDAVKSRAFATPRCAYVAVEARVEGDLAERVAAAVAARADEPAGRPSATLSE